MARISFHQECNYSILIFVNMEISPIKWVCWSFCLGIYLQLQVFLEKDRPPFSPQGAVTANVAQVQVVITVPLVMRTLVSCVTVVIQSHDSDG